MFKYYVNALVATAGLVSSAAVAHADAIYHTANMFQPITGANDAAISRNAITNYIQNISTADNVVIAAPGRSLPVPAGANQTVVINGINNAGVNGTCSVRSVAPNGFTTAGVSQNQVAGSAWSLSFTLTPAQAPAGNAFLAYCTLSANSANKLISLSVSP